MSDKTRWAPWHDGKPRRVVQLVPAQGDFVRVWAEMGGEQESVEVEDIHADPIVAWALIEVLETDYPDYLGKTNMSVELWVQHLVPCTVADAGFSSTPDVDLEDAVGICRAAEFRPDDWLERANMFFEQWRQKLGRDKQG